jgi:hypothetical protein
MSDSSSSDSDGSSGQLSLDDDPFSFGAPAKKTARKRDRSSSSSDSSEDSSGDSSASDSGDSSGEYRRSEPSRAKGRGRGRGREKPTRSRKNNSSAGKRKGRSSGDTLSSSDSDGDDSSTSPSASAAAAAANKNTELLLLSSDDDDDDDDDGIGGTAGIQVSSEVSATLREAREARQRLRAAQDANKAADETFIDVSGDSSVGDNSKDDADEAGPKGVRNGSGDDNDDYDDDVVLVGGAASTGATGAASNNASVSPAIQITIRSNAQKKQFMKKIRMSDQLKQLLPFVHKAFAIQPGCKIELQFGETPFLFHPRIVCIFDYTSFLNRISFFLHHGISLLENKDGRAMKLDKSPAFYDMEDEDMVDLVVK